MVDTRHAPDFLEQHRGNFFGIRNAEKAQDTDYDDQFYLVGPQPGKVRTHHVYNNPIKKFMGTFMAESIIVQHMSFILSDQFGLPMLRAEGQTVFEWNDFSMDQPVLTRNPPEGVAPTFRSTKKGRSVTIDRSGIQAMQEFDFSQTEDGRRLMALMIQRFQQAAVLTFSVDALYAMKAARTEYQVTSLRDMGANTYERRCLEFARKFCSAVKYPEALANRVNETKRLLKARGVEPNVIYADLGAVPYFSPMLDTSDHQTLIVQGPVPPENWVDPYPKETFMGLRLFYPNEAYDGEVLETPLVRLRCFGEYYTLSGVRPEYINPATYTTMQRTIEIVDIELGRYVKVSLEEAVENYDQFLRGGTYPAPWPGDEVGGVAKPGREEYRVGGVDTGALRDDIFRAGGNERASTFGRMDPVYVPNKLLEAMARCVLAKEKDGVNPVRAALAAMDQTAVVGGAVPGSFLTEKLAVAWSSLVDEPASAATLTVQTQPAWMTARSPEEMSKISQANLEMLRQSRNGEALTKSYETIANSKDMKGVDGANFVKNVASRLEVVTEQTLMGLEDHFNTFLTGTDDAKKVARASLTKAPAAAIPMPLPQQKTVQEYREVTREELDALSADGIKWHLVRPGTRDPVLSEAEATVQEEGLEAGMGIRYRDEADRNRYTKPDVVMGGFLNGERGGSKIPVGDLRNIYREMCNLRICKETFDILLANDIPIPFDFMVLRPFIQIRTSSLLIGKPNEAGFYVVGQDNLMYAPDVAHKVWLINYTIFHGPVITNPSAIEWIDDVYPAPNGYVGGYAAKWYTPTDWGYLANRGFLHTADPAEPTMIAMIIPYGSGERMAHVIDVRGYAKIEDKEAGRDPHFVTDWRHHASLGIDMVQNQFEPGDLEDKYTWNVLYRGHQRSWDLAKKDFVAYTQSMSPFGPKTAPDMLPIWNGERASRNILERHVNVEQYAGY